MPGRSLENGFCTRSFNSWSHPINSSSPFSSTFRTTMPLDFDSATLVTISVSDAPSSSVKRINSCLGFTPCFLSDIDVDRRYCFQLSKYECFWFPRSGSAYRDYFTTQWMFDEL